MTTVRSSQKIVECDRPTVPQGWIVGGDDRKEVRCLGIALIRGRAEHVQAVRDLEWRILQQIHGKTAQAVEAPRLRRLREPSACRSRVACRLRLVAERKLRRRITSDSACFQIVIAHSRPRNSLRTTNSRDAFQTSVAPAALRLAFCKSGLI
ncbi:MAG: hypothetical protein JO346_02765 [Alphaproteobacteria bacterium]|nr:hypothetical protein [Alphaproteobacteria bacterium]